MAKRSIVEEAKRSEKARKAAALDPTSMISLLKRNQHTTKQLCERLGASEREILDAIEKMQGRGVLVYLWGDKWGIDTAPPRPRSEPEKYKSRKDGTFVFGLSSDQHLGSKYERRDCLDSLYDHFAAAGVDRVFNAGNWIEGEARFNRNDLKVFGMDAQCQYLSESYPERPGITTYSIAGDDHEGWYGQREGVDIGKHAERIMRDNGRKDWKNMGFMEAFIDLIHAKSGAKTRMLVMHPGGGSAYADSYRPQKIVESLSGGEKPAVLLIGHYHKLGYYPIRNVHAIQTGTTQDQTPFMRKKGIQAHVGGGICELAQDPKTGAVTSCKVQFFSYYNEGFYNNRWSHGGDVVLAERN